MGRQPGQLRRLRRPHPLRPVVRQVQGEGDQQGGQGRGRRRGGVLPGALPAKVPGHAAQGVLRDGDQAQGGQAQGLCELSCYKVLSVVCHDILFHLIFYLKVYILLFIYGIYWTNLMYSGYGTLFIPPIFCWYFHRPYFQTVVPVHAQGL